MHGLSRRFRYATDEFLWGVRDYWATPGEIVKKRGGDCENIAMANYLALRALGFPSDTMRLVVVTANKPDAGSHVIVVVDVDDKTFVLDSLRQSVGTKSSLQDYRPVYALNDTSYWMYFAAPSNSASGTDRGPGLSR